MRRTGALCLAAATAGVLAALAACSGSTAGTVSGAAAKGVDGAKAAVLSVADALSLTTRKTADYTSYRERVTMVVPKAGSFTMTGSGSREPLRIDATMTGAQLPEAVHLLLSGTTEYINRGAAGARAWGGKHWLRIDLSAQGAAGKAIADSINKSSGSQDPSTSVKLLTSSGQVKRVGTETVDGVATTHYFGVVDLKKLAGSDADLKASADRAAQEGVSTESVDMWINDQNLPVKFHVTAMTSQGAEEVTIEYSDYGNTPVAITVPPSSDTQDLATLAK
nr:hypothetical protein [Streptomyces sp. 846.5]